MNKEEAINELTQMYSLSKNASAHNEAISMAIEALKQPEIIRCRNCVNRMRSPGHDWCCVNAFDIKPDDFCSYPLRRE